jgi:predicted HAD superfamily Cof-like phosphohydrolase
MNKYLKDVKEFHENFNAVIEDEIVDNNLDVRKLRLSLIFEEMVELAQAMGCTDKLEKLCEKHKIGSHKWLFNGGEPGEEVTYNRKETLDALCDLQYVLSGSTISLGYTNIFDDAFQDVHDSNMTKMCNNTKQAEETINYYKTERGEEQELSIVPKGDKFIVLRADGKVMKNIHYTAVELSKYIK